MVFEEIEALKREYTDKYVVVDATRPELRRFQSMTGIIKTVNMNGRALVEFDGLANIGWYDIDLDFLKVIDKPLPKEEKSRGEKPAAKPAAAKAAPKPQAKPAAAGGGSSVADILAAARGGGASTPAKSPEKSAGGAKSMSIDDVLAAARGGAAKEAKPANNPQQAAEKPAGKADAKAMSVADILAAARGGAAPAAEPKPVVTSSDAVAGDAADVDAGETDSEPAVESTPAATETATKSGPLPTDVAGIVAFCRQCDS